MRRDVGDGSVQSNGWNMDREGETEYEEFWRERMEGLGKNEEVIQLTFPSFPESSSFTLSTSPL